MEVKLSLESEHYKNLWLQYIQSPEYENPSDKLKEKIVDRDNSHFFRYYIKKLFRTVPNYTIVSSDGEDGGHDVRLLPKNVSGYNKLETININFLRTYNRENGTPYDDYNTLVLKIVTPDKGFAKSIEQLAIINNKRRMPIDRFNEVLNVLQLYRPMPARNQLNLWPEKCRQLWIDYSSSNEYFRPEPKTRRKIQNFIDSQDPTVLFLKEKFENLYNYMFMCTERKKPFENERYGSFYWDTNLNIDLLLLPKVWSHYPEDERIEKIRVYTMIRNNNRMDGYNSIPPSHIVFDFISPDTDLSTAIRSLCIENWLNNFLFLLPLDRIPDLISIIHEYRPLPSRSEYTEEINKVITRDPRYSNRGVANIISNMSKLYW
jgi:hypothetical protein